jgi:uncharacterized protein (DUF1697 family)
MHLAAGRTTLIFMPAIVSLLRGVNVGGHNQIKMDALRSLYAGLKLQNPQTLLQSGNVVFQSPTANLPQLSKLSQRIEDSIEQAFSFRPTVILRTAAELRHVIAANPFAARPGLDPARFLVHFLAAAAPIENAQQARALPCGTDEMLIADEMLMLDPPPTGVRELYIYFPNGIARPTLSLPRVERILGTRGTSRNWNTVTKLMEIAEELGHSNKKTPPSSH